MAANPVAEQSLTGLRQLILLLCQQSRIATLCSLPLSGARVVRRQGRSAALIASIIALMLSSRGYGKIVNKLIWIGLSSLYRANYLLHQANIAGMLSSSLFLEDTLQHWLLEKFRCKNGFTGLQMAKFI